MNISSLQTDYLNIYRSSGFGGNSERAHDVQKKCTFCGGTNHSAEKFFKRIRKEKGKTCAVDVSSNRQMEWSHRKFFTCGSEDHRISKCVNPPQDNDKQRKELHF